uniref:N-acetyltransferase domain-containing protein n=1 Tax=Corethron hystrix TaxID=216773 RepID=A0A7S1BYV7_9STRA|mmetsp:Transcript_7334/g.15866  ORF Transcript_7334/g.15866 Transcript_7334/m.15866 type:complete len:263 (+) Transcript_7334:88-876(+)
MSWTLLSLSKFILLSLINIRSSHAFGARSLDAIIYRPGTKTDELQISLTMAQNLMNPLGIDFKRFIVAASSTNEKELYGWAQLRPIGFSIRDASTYNSLPGSGSIEDEIEEDIWDEFEKDEVDFPNGFASLPWTKEYKNAAVASAKRRERRAYLEKKAEKEKIRGQNQLWELASVYVLPEWRKKGIGSELTRRLMEKHTKAGRKGKDVYLLTLDSTKSWYRDFGFEVTDEPPASMALEIAAGGILTKFVGGELICMRGDDGY